jgi:hypothetical protein
VRALAALVVVLALPASAIAGRSVPTCSVGKTSAGITVTYSGLSAGKGYYPYGRDIVEEVTSTDATVFNEGFGPPGAFIAGGSTHESHFNDPGIPVTFSLDGLKERSGPYEYYLRDTVTELSTKCS